jgi:hypothetical protein
MAEKKVYIGSMGPYLIDDTEDLNDPDGDFSGQKTMGIVADIQSVCTAAPTSDEESVRLYELQRVIKFAVEVADITSPTELSTYSSSDKGALLVAYEVSSGVNPYVIYAWDTAVAGGANPPYVVSGDGGFWTAVAGSYNVLDPYASELLQNRSEAFMLSLI